MTEIKDFRCNVCESLIKRESDGRTFKGRGLGRYCNGWRFGPLNDHFTHLCDDCIKQLALLLSPITHTMQGKAACSFAPGDTVYMGNDGLAYLTKQKDGFEPGG